MTLQEELVSLLGKDISEAADSEIYEACLELVRQRAEGIPYVQGSKKIYYISAEFLTGKQLGKNLINLGLYDEMSRILRINGKSIDAVENVEKEPSLGNGGLGRLAACFLDSIATLNLPGDGIGLRYHYGLFKQQFRDHKQYEIPDEWLDCSNMLKDTGISFPIQLAGKVYQSRMYDMDVIGYKGNKNTLHLFDLDSVDDSIVHDGIQFDKTNIEKNLTLFLYPDDSDRDGQLLRIYQQYFMVSNAAQLIIKNEKDAGHDLHRLDQYVAVQINDTHPSMVIPELIRLLMVEGIPMKRAADIVNNVCAYTNHTILAEALEKWPLDYLAEVVPHLLPIIEGLDYAAYCAFSGNPDLMIIDENNRVHMAKMDMHYSRSINGVAALHTEILKNQELKPFYNVYPQRFNNKTNGITFRRFLMHSNPKLTNLIDTLIGEGWKQDASHLEELLRYYNDENVLNQLEEIKYQNKVRLAAYVKERENVDIDPNSVFDVQIKR
ncbi:MAG: glycogen/starch/alpha-glucan phosphorylase, partial [Solobacterium sp.]|nr:glycogen/starch/alpha-glucan phosphorylase [Solobacterium sp.]